MNLEELKELFEILEQRDITEFELEEDGVKLRIRTGGARDAVAREGATGPPSLDQGAAAEANYDLAANGLALVTAPMVGTFYRQSSPGAEPYAREGDRVEKGQTLCIIEAMKLMNEIESEIQGELVAIYVEDGQPVQYGDKLFAIREI